MHWLYRLQQRTALTRSETNVVLALSLLFGLGLTAQYIQSQPRPLPDGAYAQEQQAFADAVPAAPSPGSEASPLPTLATKPAATQPATTKSAPRTPARRAKASLPTTPIDLNAATSAELQRLPRIGPKMAARIIAFREAHGGFRRVQDLTRVRGIGQKTLAKLAPHVTVGD